MPVKDLAVISNNLLRIVSKSQGATYYIPRTDIIGITADDIILNTKTGDFKLHTETQNKADRCVERLTKFVDGEKYVEPVRWDMPVPDYMALELLK
jgi:hypothetical protein